MATIVGKLVGKKEEEEEREHREHVHHHHRHHKDRHRERQSSAKVILKDETPAHTVPQLERKIAQMREHVESDLTEKDALLKLIISGIQNLNDNLEIEKNERCDDVDELHNFCTKVRRAVEQEADARYAVDQSLQSFKEHSDNADLSLKSDIEQLQEFQRDTIEDKKIIMGAIMELEEKLNELRSTHSHQIDDLLINQGQIRKSIEEQIQIIHRIQLSDFENATLKIQDIQSKLQEQILTQAEDFRELTVEANKSMVRQNNEMLVIKKQIDDRIDELGGSVDKKERGLQIKLNETKEKFGKIEAQFAEVTTKFDAVNGQVETAIDQIHSTRARAEEATDIQKNRFDYFDMFMQSLKQSQATIDSRIGFLYTIVNELRWRERAENARTTRITRQHSSSNIVSAMAAEDTRSTKSGKSVSHYSTGVDYAELDNVTQAVNDIEMEMKAKIEVLTESLEQHRKETLHAISRARDKSLASTTAVDKLQTVVERMNDKFGDIARLEGEMVAMKKKTDHTDRKVDHLEGLSETATKKVDILARKMWEMFDSDMTLATFIDHHLKDDKERLWRLEYETNHLKHMTIGENVDDATLPLHLQNSTVTGDMGTVQKNISRCLVKSEQLVDDVTNIAKQNDMIRNDMRDLKLLCDYLSSKNDETQRYCRALRKHLEFTNRKLESYETGKPFRFFKSREDEMYEFEGDLPDLYETRKKTPVESPKPSTPILNLFMRNKERRVKTPEPIETLPLKSTRRSPSPLPHITSPSLTPAARAAPSPKAAPPPPRSPKTSGGFFGLFGRKEPGTPPRATTPPPPPPEIGPATPLEGEGEGEDPKPKGILERIFGKDEPSPSPPPKHIGHLKKKKMAPPPPEKPSKQPRPARHHSRERSGTHVNVPTADPELKEEMEEHHHHHHHHHHKKSQKTSLEAKQEREARLMDATEKARAARANEKVIKGELPTMDGWKGEERVRQESYERRKAYLAEQERLKREYVVAEARTARERMEAAERERRAANSQDRASSLEREMEHHQIKPSFGELPPEAVQQQKRQEEAATKIQAAFRGHKVRKSAEDSADESSESDSSEVSSSEEEDSAEAILASAPSPPPPPSPPPQELEPEPEPEPAPAADPWDFDIEERSQALIPEPAGATNYKERFWKSPATVPDTVHEAVDGRRGAYSSDK